MTISVTPAAGTFMRRLLEGRDDVPHAALRLTVSAGGCAGFVVQVRLEAQPQPGDTQLELGGLKVLLPPEARALLTGATLDVRGDGAGLALLNPNVSDCGCGNQGAGRGGRHATVSVVPFGPRR